MRGKLELVAWVLDCCAGGHRLGRWRSWWQRDLPILAYHRVLEIGDEATYPFDPEEVSATPAMFRQQMDYVARHFDPITFADLIEALDGSGALPPRPIIVTFDDGYADNYSEAFPILRATGVPATIFVTTGHLGTDEPFWHDRLVYSLLHASVDEIRVPDTDLRLPLGDPDARRATSRQLIQLLRRVPDLVRRDRLERLGEQIEMRVAAADLELCRAMSWEQAREMSAAGIEFGSHTVTHPALSQLDAPALRFELGESKRRLEAELGVPAVSTAFPFGGVEDYDDEVIRGVQAAGYRVACSYISGTNARRSLDRFELRRIHVERYTSKPMFTSMLALPQLFAA